MSLLYDGKSQQVDDLHVLPKKRSKRREIIPSSGEINLKLVATVNTV